jgi:hypothetical protein
MCIVSIKDCAMFFKEICHSCEKILTGSRAEDILQNVAFVFKYCLVTSVDDEKYFSTFK